MIARIYHSFFYFCLHRFNLNKFKPRRNCPCSILSSVDLVWLFRHLIRMMRLTCAQDEVTALIHLTLIRNSSGSNWPLFINPTPSTRSSYVFVCPFYFRESLRRAILYEKNYRINLWSIRIIKKEKKKKQTFKGCQRTMKCSISMVIKPNQFVQVRHDRLSVIVGNNLINRTTVREKKLYKINQIYLQFVLYYLIVIVYKSEVWKSPIDKISFTGVDSTRKFISLEWVHCYRNELNCVYNRSRGLSIRSMAVHYTRHGIRLRESNDSHSTHPRKRTLHPNVASRNLIICFTTSHFTR